MYLPTIPIGTCLHKWKVWNYYAYITFKGWVYVYMHSIHCSVHMSTLPTTHSIHRYIDACGCDLFLYFICYSLFSIEYTTTICLCVAMADCVHTVHYTALKWLCFSCSIRVNGHINVNAYIETEESIHICTRVCSIPKIVCTQCTQR